MVHGAMETSQLAPATSDGHPHTLQEIVAEDNSIFYEPQRAWEVGLAKLRAVFAPTMSERHTLPCILMLLIVDVMLLMLLDFLHMHLQVVT